MLAAASGADEAEEQEVRGSIEFQSSQAERLSLLSDAQMRSFIASGFLALAAPELPASFHSELYAKASRAFGPESGNGLLTNVAVGITAELQELLRSPTVAGALVSLLGPGFTFGHLGSGGCALHASATGGDQLNHKDSQRSGVNGARTRAVMLMYYPGASDERMGPTSLVPSSHLLAPEGLGLSLGVTEPGAAAQADQEDWSGVQDPTATAPSLAEHKLVLPRAAEAPNLVFVHEDLGERGHPNGRCLSLGCLFTPAVGCCLQCTARRASSTRMRRGGRCSK